MQEYAYTAFISYRHTEPDEAIARKLHTYIENYAIPREIRRASGRQKMGRVFRDQEELPLSTDLGGDIRAALENSEWFIAVCSPRYLESRWCIAELEYYIALGRQDHILVILAEGEPQDAFPPQLRYKQVDGGWVEVEPLAGDVRAESLSASLKKLSHEKLRLLAPMLGVNYDQLRQRARRRRMHMIAGAAAAGFVLLAGFLSYALIKNGQVSRQRDIALENEEQMLIQRDRAMNSQMQLLIQQANHSVAGGNKLNAITTLREAIGMRDTVGDSNDDDLCNALEYALYCESFGTVQTINNDNRQFDEMIFSYDDRYLLGISNYYSATLIDAENGEMLYTVSRGMDSEVDGVGFTKDNRYFYTVDAYRGVVLLYEVATGELYRTYEYITDGNYMISENIFPLSDGRLVIPKEKSILIWDYEADTGEEILPASGGPMDIYTRLEIVALSPDESTLAFGSPGYGYGMRLVRLSDLSEITLEHRVGRGSSLTVEGKDDQNAKKTDERGYWGLSFSGDGRYLTAKSGSVYFVWDAANGRMVLEQELDSTYVMGGMVDTLLSQDGSVLFVMTSNYLGAIQVKNGKTLWEKTTESNISTAAVVSPNGKYISASGGIEGIFDVMTGELLSDRSTTRFSHDGTLLIADTFGNEPVLLAAPEISTAKRVADYQTALYSAARYTDPPKAVAISLSHQSAPFYNEYPGNAGRSQRIFNSPDLRYCVQTHPDGFIEVFDISDPDHTKEIYCLADHCFENVTDVTFNGGLMATCGGYDPRCVLFDLTAGDVLHVLPGVEYVHGCEFSKDGEKIILLCGMKRDVALVYSASSGNLLYRFDAPEGKSFAKIGFNESGTEVAAVTEAGDAVVGTLYPGLTELMDAAMKH